MRTLSSVFNNRKRFIVNLFEIKSYLDSAMVKMSVYLQSFWIRTRKVNKTCLRWIFCLFSGRQIDFVVTQNMYVINHLCNNTQQRDIHRITCIKTTHFIFELNNYMMIRSDPFNFYKTLDIPFLGRT